MDPSSSRPNLYCLRCRHAPARPPLPDNVDNPAYTREYAEVLRTRRAVSSGKCGRGLGLRGPRVAQPPAAKPVAGPVSGSLSAAALAVSLVNPQRCGCVPDAGRGEHARARTHTHAHPPTTCPRKPTDSPIHRSTPPSPPPPPLSLTTHAHIHPPNGTHQATHTHTRHPHIHAHPPTPWPTHIHTYWLSRSTGPALGYFRLSRTVASRLCLPHSQAALGRHAWASVSSRRRPCVLPPRRPAPSNAPRRRSLPHRLGLSRADVSRAVCGVRL